MPHGDAHTLATIGAADFSPTFFGLVGAPVENYCPSIIVCVGKRAGDFILLDGGRQFFRHVTVSQTHVMEDWRD